MVNGFQYLPITNMNDWRAAFPEEGAAGFVCPVQGIVVTVKDLALPWDTSPVSKTREPEESILEALRAMAFADAEVTSRAESLFMFLRKVSTQSTASDYLMGMQFLAASGEPAGARLLAAFLDVSTPGDRLLPRVNSFSSSRRLRFRILSKGDDPANIHQDWLERLDKLAIQAAAMVPAEPPLDNGGVALPGSEPPWPQLRDTLDLLLARLSLGDDFSSADRELLVAALRLEIDAWQERISHLAGSIDPFRVAAISRILPLLSMADAEIRDLRQMTAGIEDGCLGAEFDKPLSRSLDVLEDNDRSALRKALRSDPELAPLADLFDGVAEHPVQVPVLGHCLLKLQSLAGRLAILGIPDVDLDMVTGARLIQSHFRAGGSDKELELPLPAGFPQAVGQILEMAESGMGIEAADLSGVTIKGETLVISIPDGGAFLEHDFPSVAQDAPDEGEVDEIMDWADELQKVAVSAEDPDEEIDPNNASVAELKHLVMTNIQSVSVLLGFLRNPKIVAIPGLVEEVVNRSRNPKVIETIAKVRLLHTGFANRGVPRVCLRSPVNIPLAVLRKFIHVKYVSKMDLKRMAVDKAGMRKEVCREIQKYLKSLT